MRRSMSREVAFKLAGERDPLILVPTLVNGNGPFDFILDTGASHCLLSTELARMLGITPGKANDARDAGGTLQVFEGGTVQLSVGETTRRDVLVGIADLQALSKRLRIPISGVLGSNFLADFELTIDYPAGTLCFQEGHHAELHRRAGELIPLPFKATPLLLVPVKVNGQGPYDFVLDTGASATLFSPELTAHLGITARDGVDVVGAVTAGMGARCVVESFTLGTAEQRHLGIVVADIFGPLAQRVGARIDGVLGYDVLKAYRVTLNYVEQTLLLQQFGNLSR